MYLSVLKLAPAEYRICYECVQFQIEVRKISRCGSRSSDNAEFGPFTYFRLFCTGRQRNVSKIITHVHSRCFAHLSFLFRDVLVAVAVVFCVRSLVLITGGVYRRWFDSAWLNVCSKSFIKSVISYTRLHSARGQTG